MFNHVISRVKMSYSKVVTGLTGLNVAKNPTHTLGVLYRYDSKL